MATKKINISSVLREKQRDNSDITHTYHIQWKHSQWIRQPSLCRGTPDCPTVARYSRSFPYKRGFACFVLIQISAYVGVRLRGPGLGKVAFEAAGETGQDMTRMI